MTLALRLAQNLLRVEPNFLDWSPYICFWKATFTVGEDMAQERVSTRIQKLDFSYENSTFRIIANRNSPKITLVGLEAGPFEEGNEYEVHFWIAKELIRTGIARPREGELLDTSGLYKIQWKERVQSTRQISKLPENFYPKLRRFLTQLTEEAAKKPEKIREQEKIRHLIQDLTNSRLKKIIVLASAPAQTEQVLSSLADEERLLYDEIYRLVNEWRNGILTDRGEEK